MSPLANNKDIGSKSPHYSNPKEVRPFKTTLSDWLK
jgi:hypothetical protein